MIPAKEKFVSKATDFELEICQGRELLMSKNIEELSSLPSLVFQVELTVC